VKRALAIVLLASSALWAKPQKVPSPIMDSLLTAGIDQTLRQEYESAVKTFQIIVQEFPDHPCGFLYQAAVMQTKAMDYDLPMDRSTFDSLLALAEERSSAMIAREPNSPWGYFYRGTMLGYDSYARALRGDWFGAASKGMSSVSDFHRAVAADSSFFDAYAGIGTYYYWKTRKMEFLAWLPFVGDKREEGIEFLFLCAERGEYNRFTAMSSLLSIYLDNEEYERAVYLAREALRFYPSNRLFLWGLAASLEKLEDTTGALRTYGHLLELMVNDPQENSYNELVCRLNMVKLELTRLGRSDLRSDLDIIFSLRKRKFPEHLKNRAEAKFDEAESLRKELLR
jgi:tetratricopeptide (TPR) repeat protein